MILFKINLISKVFYCQSDVTEVVRFFGAIEGHRTSVHKAMTNTFHLRISGSNDSIHPSCITTEKGCQASKVLPLYRPLVQTN